MTDRTPPTDSIEKILDALIRDFDQLRNDAADLDMSAKDFIDDHVMDMGKQLPHLPESKRIPKNEVSGCAAKVWIIPDLYQGLLYFDADSNSVISRGSIALLLKFYSGRSPREILDFDARAALDRLGLPSALTRQRANGLNSMVGRIREAALAVQ